MFVRDTHRAGVFHARVQHRDVFDFRGIGFETGDYDHVLAGNANSSVRARAPFNAQRLMALVAENEANG